MSINDYAIYDLLHSYLPEEYPALRKLPKALDHPGEQPKSPKKTETLSFSIDANTDFDSLAKEFDYIVKRGERKVEFSVRCETLGTETRTDEWEGYEYEATIYGKANKIDFYAIVEPEDFKFQLKQYEKKTKEWSQKVDARRARKDRREFVIEQNNGQIFAARSSDLNLWKLAAKSLSGRLDVDFKSIVRNRLLDKLWRLGW